MSMKRAGVGLRYLSPSLSALSFSKMIYLFLFYTYECFVFMYVYHVHAWYSCRQKEAIRSPGMESRVTLSHQKDAGTESGSSEREAQAEGSTSQEAGFESS